MIFPSSVQIIIDIQMSFDKLKNLFTRTFDTKDQESLISQASNFISSSRRPIVENPIAQFESYLALLPTQQLKQLKNHKRSTRTASLRPQMVKRCYQNVPQLYFSPQYEVKGEMLVRNRKQITQRTSKMHEHLDEVQLCLFNQITSRFDEILSVLRTIESLQCIVVFNAKRLKAVRESNMELTKQVSSRHLKIVGLLKKQEKLKSVISKMEEIRVYQKFLLLKDSELSLNRSNSQHYQSINQIRGKRELYFQLAATKDYEERVEQFETNLKKSYSDTINDSIFKYTTQIFNYSPGFWQKKFLGRVIFQQDENQGQNTVILDESVLVQQDALGGFNLKLSQQSEKNILDNILNGWKQGFYTMSNLKAAFQKFIKQKHFRFTSDCRNFAFQSYLRQQRKKIQNPSLANLLRQMTILFCTKTFVYYADMYRNLLTRIFSVVSKSIQAILSQQYKQLCMQDRQKLSTLIDGLFGIPIFLFKQIYEKVVEIIDMKEIHDSMEINDFKQLINVYQTEEDFIEKNLKKYLHFTEREDCFLTPIVRNCIGRLDLGIVTKFKKEKVESFLNRTHRYILQNQLKQSFQNQVWQPTDIPTIYYDSLHYLITGQSLNLRRNKNHTIRHNVTNNFQSSVFFDRMQEKSIMNDGNKIIGNFRIIRNQIIVESKIYKVTQTLLLLMEIIEDYLHIAQFYPFVSQQVGIKIYQLLKNYNSISNQLIILGGAVKLQKIKTKNITARHLALNSLCLSFIIYIMDCISKRIQIYQQQKIRKQILQHEQSILKKLNSILASKINQALPDINFNTTPTKGTQFIVNNTKILHDILADFYNKEMLSKIFIKENTQVYLNKLRGMEIRTKIQAESLKDDLNFYFHELVFLEKIIPEFQGMRLEGEDLLRDKFEDL